MLSRRRRSPTIPEIQARFLSVLPRIQRHARIAFRDICCHHRKADCIQETVAIAWKWYRRSIETGGNPDEFISTLSAFATRHVRSGRRLVRGERAKEVLSPTAQVRHQFTVSPVPTGSSQQGHVFDEALADNTRSPIPEQAGFRIDFPRWLDQLPAVKRRLVGDLMIGMQTQEVARLNGVSSSRVSQVRRECFDSWRSFHDEDEA